jgi:sec-independent protein translocase protein TatA
MFGLGPMELAIILAIVVILFGARRLPEIGSGVGKAIKNFKAGISGNEIDVTPGPSANDSESPSGQNEKVSNGKPES